MENFVILEGGSGSKVALAFAHCVATGMLRLHNGEKVHMMICDKDANCGDTTEAAEVISELCQLSSPNCLTVNPSNPIINRKTLFTSPAVNVTYDFTDVLENVVRDVGIGTNGGNLSIADCIVSHRNQSNDRLLLDTFYSSQQQQEDLTVGFKGSASRGQLVFSFLLEHDNTMFEPIKNYIERNPGAHCRVFIVGSIFGGTGASMFIKTAESVRDIAPGRIHIAGALMLPGFCFEDNNDCDIKSARFWGKTFTSLRGYGDYANLVKKYSTDENGLLDRLYLAAQPNNELHFCAKRVVNGGSGQCRKTDLIDLIGASYILDFFNSEPDPENMCFARGDINNPCENIYTVNYPEVNPQNRLDLSCVANASDCFVPFLKFCSFIFYLQWQIQTEPHMWRVDWLTDKCFHRRDIRHDEDNFRNDVQSVLDPIFTYCCHFVDFCMELALNGKPADGQNGYDYSENYRLFHYGNVRLLYEIKQSLSDGNHPCERGRVVDATNITDFCGGSVSSAQSAYANVVPKNERVDNLTRTEIINGYLNSVYDYIKQKG